MKRYVVLVAVALMAFSATLGAQVKFGVTAGMNFNSAKVGDVKMDAKAGWNAGATLQVDLPLGFSLQPSLVYMHNAAGFESQIFSSQILGDIKAEFAQAVGSVVLPVSVQWGPDLIIVRPFIDVTPYVGYSLFNKLKGDVLGIEETLKGGNGFDCGLGVGAGLNVWKLQAIVRYNWNFGVLGNYEGFTEVDLKDSLNIENTTFGGVTVSLAYFF